MLLLYRIRDALRSSLHRLLARKVTAFSAVLGLTLAISLVLSISLYADGIYYQIFLNNVAKTRENPENEVSIANPTFTFLFHYFGGWHGSKTWDDLSLLDDYLTQKGVRTLNIPSIDLVRLFETDHFYLFPQGNTTNINSLYLSRSSFGVMSNLDEHVSLVSGRFPQDDTKVGDEPIEILVNENLASRAGLDLNQNHLAYFKTVSADGKRETLHLPVKITGIWKANDPSDDYWIFAPSYYEGILFTNERSFFSRLGSNFPEFIHNAHWYLIMDANYVHADEVDDLLKRIDRLERGANEIQPDLWLSISPKGALVSYANDARILRILLYAFAIPIVGLIFAFIGLVAKLSTEQRRNEIAVIRSRGGTKGLVLGFAAIDGLILGTVSLGLSLLISMWLAQFMAKTGAFSEFSASSGIRLSLSNGMVRIGFFAVSIFLGMFLLPISRAARDTIISHRAVLGRTTQKPWWQRIWLDFLLFIPAAYGAYLLQKQGSLALLGFEGLNSDPFRNPLLFLVPSLGILSLSLFSLRLIRPVMTVFDYLINWTPWAGLTIAIRHIARRPVNYHTPLLILTLTVSLFTYTASLTTTFDQHLTAQEYYKAGADIQFFDPGDSTISGDHYQWDFFPVEDYTRIEGVQSAARLGRYAAQIYSARIQAKGIFIGIDRLAFPNAAYWREDFAGQSLGALLNILAEDSANVLVNSEFLRQNGLVFGDTIQATVKTYNQHNTLNLKIAGAFDYFPTWYPEQGPLLVGNLENLFLNASGIFPYYVLLKTEAGVDPTTIERDRIRSMDQLIRPVDWKTPTQFIYQAQSLPERQGLLGILFIGSIASVLITVMAFLLHLVFTFQQRSVELSVLRAGGLSTIQMITILVWEFTFLIILGGAIGTILGLLAGRAFIPYLQVGEGSAAKIPPFQVLVPWEMITQFYWLFGILFAVSLFVSVLLLRQSRIFEAIKLGESI